MGGIFCFCFCFCFFAASERIILKGPNVFFFLIHKIKLMRLLVSRCGLACQQEIYIGSGQSSAHPLPDDKWLARSAITWGS